MSERKTVDDSGVDTPGVDTPGADAPGVDTPGVDTLFDFPCDFPIKVMGKSHPEFQTTIVDVIREFDGELDTARIEVRPSSSGTYTGLTVTVRATSRTHLDDIYRALTGHPMVKVVL